MTDDEKILATGVWEMDDTPYTLFSDRMVVTRTTSKCAVCFGPIIPRQRVRTRIERCEDYGVKTFR